MKQEDMQNYFNIFKAFQPAYKSADAKRRNYLIRSFSSAQGAFFDNSWRVVGITQNALEAFKAVDFKRIPKRKDPIPVERAHIHQRHTWISEMFETEWNDPEKWWQWVWERDACVLSTAAENIASDQQGIPLIIAHEIPQDMGYFQTNYIGCKYRKNVERALLESFLVP